MTSKLTRERIELIANFHRAMTLPPSHAEIEELARMALAAMDSEPVIVVGDDGGDALSYRRFIQSFEPGTKLYRHAQPALVIPDEMTAEQAYEIGYYYGDPVDVFARGANWMRQHIIDSTLAAAPQSPGGDHATVPGTWIPVSERMPEDEQEVLTINRMGHCFVSFFDKHSGLFFDRLDAPAACCIEHVLVTHWMPLPAAPQEVK
ncbi:DUF551 domain-containing protein [Klebsiella oxytoca]|nr:DUF551 domain-containing protein [Klebsiella oxytoca]MCW4547421.1 DUF551 domain-containing protein [Klebsiella oxytoca]